MLLNDDIGAIPLTVYRGDYAYNADRLQNFHQTRSVLIPWEQITITDCLTEPIAGWAGRSLRSAQPAGPAIRPHLA